jgi:hypothetical protein
MDRNSDRYLKLNAFHPQTPIPSSDYPDLGPVRPHFVQISAYVCMCSSYDVKRPKSFAIVGRYLSLPPFKLFPAHIIKYSIFLGGDRPAQINRLSMQMIRLVLRNRTQYSSGNGSVRPRSRNRTSHPEILFSLLASSRHLIRLVLPRRTPHERTHPRNQHRHDDGDKPRSNPIPACWGRDICSGRY